MTVGFLNPDKILGELALWPDMTAADFGCGSGGWTIPLAKRLKKGKVYGLVYGLDILEEPLSVLQSRAKLEKISNIKTITADLEREKGSTLKNHSLDLVLATNLFFQIEDKSAILKEIKRVLKKGAQVLVVDWLKETPLGPKEDRVSAEETKKLAEEQGFELKKEFKAGIYHWGLVLIKE